MADVNFSDASPGTGDNADVNFERTPTLRVRTMAGWETKPPEDTAENRLRAEEVDDTFLFLAGTVAGKAGQASLDALASDVDGKASQASLDALANDVDGKADADGDYAELRARGTTKEDVGLGNVDNVDFQDFGLGTNNTTLSEGTYGSHLSANAFYGHSTSFAPSDAPVAQQGAGIHFQLPWGRFQLHYVNNGGNVAGSLWSRHSTDQTGDSWEEWLRIPRMIISEDPPSGDAPDGTIWAQVD